MNGDVWRSRRMRVRRDGRLDASFEERTLSGGNTIGVPPNDIVRVLQRLVARG